MQPSLRTKLSKGLLGLGFGVFAACGLEEGPALFTPDNPESYDTAEELSTAALYEKLSVEEYELDVLENLSLEKIEIDTFSMAHTRYQQTYRGVPVFGGEVIAHLDKEGELATLTDTLVKKVKVESTTPSFSEGDAIRRVLDRYDCEECLSQPAKADVWILRHQGKDQLAYRVQLYRLDGTEESEMPVVFLNAKTGEELWRYDNLQTGSVTGSGVSLYSDTVPLTTYQSGSTYYLENVNQKVGTFNCNNGTSNCQQMTDTNNIWDTTSQKAAVDAHYAATKTLEYFLNVHGRNGINGNGGPGTRTSIDGTTSLFAARVHYSSNYNNAFWDGSTVTFGDGGGGYFSPLVSPDVVGHEMSHGVVQFTANLTYSGQSGGLNESYADIFGAMVERAIQGSESVSTTWKIGEEIYLGSRGWLRSMDNPTADGNSLDHYSDYYNQDVHYSSGIPNNAFYLLSAGGTHRKSGRVVQGIGADDAAKIWYRALATYMTSNTNFSGARTATLNAAKDLFGESSAQYKSVGQTWCAVGLGGCEAVCGDGRLEEAELCDDGNTTNGDGCDASCRLEGFSYFPEAEPNDDGAVGVNTNDFSTANADGPFDAVNGDVWLTASLAPAGDDDVFSFTNSSGGIFKVTAETFGTSTSLSCNNAQDTVIEIRSATGSVLATNDDKEGTNRCSRISDFSLMPGKTYFLRVIDYEDNDVLSSYSLQLRFTQLPCGNGVLDSGEECDDGNIINGDGCDSDCTYTCGSGIPADGRAYDAANDRCYLAFSTLRTWQSAQNDCVAKGGHLATISSSQENALVRSTIAGNPWIGLADSNNEDATDGIAGDDFTWVNGMPVTYTNFNTGEPNNSGGNEDCVNLVYNQSTWNDYLCTGVRPYVCELEPACGNGVVDSGEECDDGNRQNGDGCEASCTYTCGSGIVADGRVFDPATQHCYLAFGTLRTWQSAQNDCVAKGGHLATISSSQENTLVRSTRTGHLWIGLNDMSAEDATDGIAGDDFVWVDGSPVTYTNFNTGEPNDSNGGEDCVNLVSGQSTWNDYLCNGGRPYVCEIED